MAEYINKKLLMRHYAWLIDERPALKELIDDIVEQQPVVELPVWRTEPPKNDGEYIVMISGAAWPTCLQYETAFDGWHDECGNDYEVLAWQPMPAPYKA